jgi:hypothetical protein
MLFCSTVGEGDIIEAHLAGVESVPDIRNLRSGVRSQRVIFA